MHPPTLLLVHQKIEDLRLPLPVCSVPWVEVVLHEFPRRGLAISLLLVYLLTCTDFIASAQAESDTRPNVLLLCIDDLRPELNCYGANYIQSPNIDRLASRGFQFNHHYVQAPTCGASRYALLTGRYGGGSNGALFSRAKRLANEPGEVPPSMPAWFRQHGYTTVSVGKVSHHPGGRGGPNWNDDSQPEMPNSWDRHLMPCGPWQHPRGAMHGLAHGEIRVRAKDMDVFQSEPGDDSIFPDGLTVEAASQQLVELTADDTKPFFLAVGIIRPHLPFGAPEKYMQPYRDKQLPPIIHPRKPPGRSTWHRSGEFMKYNRWGRNPNNDPDFATLVRRHYAACVSYADALVGRLVDQLRQSGELDRTVIVLWGDHGWHLGEHAIWGKHSLFEESLRSPLIVSYPGMPNMGKKSEAVVETIDIFPTLCQVADLPVPHFAHGSSLVPLIDDPQASGHPAISYFRSAASVRTDSHRLIQHDDGFIELYDQRTPAGETRNVADSNQKLVIEMTDILESRYPNPN